MSGMVDHVARALMQSLHQHDDWDVAPAAMQEAYRRQARVAVQAMRKPDIKMDLMACRYLDGLAKRELVDPVEVWQVMVEAALK